MEHKYVRMNITTTEDPDLCLRCPCGREFWASPTPEECVVFIRDGDGAWPNPGRLYPECPDCRAVHRPGHEVRDNNCSTQDPSCFYQAGCDCGTGAE